jgi:hypothetical protein
MRIDAVELGLIIRDIPIYNSGRDNKLHFPA